MTPRFNNVYEAAAYYELVKDSDVLWLEAAKELNNWMTGAYEESSLAREIRVEENNRNNRRDTSTGTPLRRLRSFLCVSQDKETNGNLS